jgi:hypothetical protein
MEIWEQIETIGPEFNVFYENIEKKDRTFLNRCSVKEYDKFMLEHFKKQ